MNATLAPPGSPSQTTWNNSFGTEANSTASSSFHVGVVKRIESDDAGIARIRIGDRATKEEPPQASDDEFAPLGRHKSDKRPAARVDLTKNGSPRSALSASTDSAGAVVKPKGKE